MQKLISTVRAAVDKYEMISDGDKIAVGISGGKDSLTLLCAMAEMRRFYPQKYDLVAISIDNQVNGEPADYSLVEELCRRLKVPFVVKRTQLWDIIFNIRKENNPCSLCARMRRGALHDAAIEYGCNKIALGHHLDDAVETFYMNLLQGGSISSFQPISYLSRKNLYLIRPMSFVYEREVVNLSNKLNLPVMKSKCSVDGKTERQVVKELIDDLEKKYTGLRGKTLGAMQRADVSGWGLIKKTGEDVNDGE